MALADALSVGVLECRGGRIQAANVAFARLMAAQEDALQGLGLDAYVADCGSGIPDWLAGEQPPGCSPERVVECVLRALDGSVRQVALRPLGDARWEVVDLTLLHSLGEEVKRANQGLLAARRKLEELHERLEGEIREREELLRVVSHELRTPITVIAGFSRLLLSEQAGPLNDDQRHFLRQTRESCDRLDRFVESLLLTGQVLGADAGLSLREASLEVLLEGIAAFLKPLVDERCQHLEVRVAADADQAWFDPQRIEQVLINLVGNALKYSPDGGQILVRAETRRAAAQRYVEVSVEDEGPGVPDADRLRIFAPYVRGESAPDGGLGLGLAICRRIVEAHEGVIQVSESAAGGARFSFTLPLRKAA